MPANPSVELLRSPHEKVDTMWFHEILYYGPDAFTSLDDPVGPLEPIVDMEEYLNTLADHPSICISVRKPTDRFYAFLYRHDATFWRVMGVSIEWDPMGEPQKPVFYQSKSVATLLAFLNIQSSASLIAAIDELPI